MLYIFGGLPGTGKSTLASALARERNAAYLRVDTIEQSIKNTLGQPVGPEGYEVAYALAIENLRLGTEVVADSTNSLEVTRQDWRQSAMIADSLFVEIEIICSDLNEHERRVETRKTSIKGLKLPTWEQVQKREYHPWTTRPIVIDTSNDTIEQSFAKLQEKVSGYLNAIR